MGFNALLTFYILNSQDRRFAQADSQAKAALQEESTLPCMGPLSDSDDAEEETPSVAKHSGRAEARLIVSFAMFLIWSS